MTDRGERLPERWEMLYRTAYSRMIGARLKRFRENRHLTQGQALRLVKKPRGAPYSQPLLSRIEAGYANSPLYVYGHLAQAFEISTDRLMGPAEAEKPIGEAELVLVKFLRHLGISPDEAMARLAEPPASRARRADGQPTA